MDKKITELKMEYYKQKSDAFKKYYIGGVNITYLEHQINLLLENLFKEIEDNKGSEAVDPVNPRCNCCSGKQVLISPKR